MNSASFLRDSSCWLINDRSSLAAKFTDFDNENGSIPDNLIDIPVGPGVNLDIGNLGTQGEFGVPTLIEGNDEFKPTRRGEACQGWIAYLAAEK